jgi:hypothetical protein
VEAPAERGPAAIDEGAIAEPSASQFGLCGPLDLEQQALAAGGERGFELVEAGAVVEIEQAGAPGADRSRGEARDRWE